MKKTLVLLLAMILTLSMMIPAMASQEPYKIAIITGTTTQGEEEYRAAEKLKEQYPDIVITDTYPDKFAAEVETTIGKILDVDLPRPRDRKALLEHPRFYSYRQEVLHFLAEYDHGPEAKAA